MTIRPKIVFERGGAKFEFSGALFPNLRKLAAALKKLEPLLKSKKVVASRKLRVTMNDIVTLSADSDKISLALKVYALVCQMMSVLRLYFVA